MVQLLPPPRFHGTACDLSQQVAPSVVMPWHAGVLTHWSLHPATFVVVVMSLPAGRYCAFMSTQGDGVMIATGGCGVAENGAAVGSGVVVANGAADVRSGVVVADGAADVRSGVMVWLLPNSENSAPIQFLR